MCKVEIPFFVNERGSDDLVQMAEEESQFLYEWKQLVKFVFITPVIMYSSVGVYITHTKCF